MPQCVATDSGGFLYVTTETYPQCAELAITDPAHLSRLTYWADLAITLDPSGTDLYALLTAILLVFVTAFGFKMVARQILNR